MHKNIKPRDVPKDYRFCFYRTITRAENELTGIRWLLADARNTVAVGSGSVGHALAEIASRLDAVAAALLDDDETGAWLKAQMGVVDEADKTEAIPECVAALRAALRSGDKDDDSFCHCHRQRATASLRPLPLPAPLPLP